jgi:hypothetical protein
MEIVNENVPAKVERWQVSEQAGPGLWSLAFIVIIHNGKPQPIFHSQPVARYLCGTS